jgi:hypothetical protein
VASSEDVKAILMASVSDADGSAQLTGEPYRGKSLERNCLPLGPYGKPVCADSVSDADGSAQLTGESSSHTMQRSAHW